MATRKPRKPTAAPPSSVDAAASPLEGVGSVLSTLSGPSAPSIDAERAQDLPTEGQQRLARKFAGTQALARSSSPPHRGSPTR
jgi:hypothetical protein